MSALIDVTAHRTRVRTSTSASSGWAARLAELRAQAHTAPPATQPSTTARTAGSMRGAPTASSSTRA